MIQCFRAAVHGLDAPDLDLPDIAHDGGCPEVAHDVGHDRDDEELQNQGLLVKFRRKGTFTRFPGLSLDVKAAESTLLAYLQADYEVGGRREEAATRIQA